MTKKHFLASEVRSRVEKAPPFTKEENCPPALRVGKKKNSEKRLACSAGVFIGRAMLKLEKRGEMGRVKGAGERGGGREKRKHCENEKHPLISRA